MSSLRVLLADNDSDFRDSAQRALTRQGYFVVPVANGVDALDRLGTEQFDVIVADVSLAERDGLEVLRAAKTLEPPPPVILLTEVRHIASAASGVREGAFDYLLKPLDDFIRLALFIDRAVGKYSPAEVVSAAETVEPAEMAGRAAKRVLEATAAGTELNQLLSLYAAELAKLANAPHAAVLLAHNDRQLHLTASHGYADRTEAARKYVQTVGDDFGWEVASTRDLVWHSASGNGSTPAGSDIQEVLGVPLLFRDDVLGIAVAYSTAPRNTFHPSALDGIKHLTQQAALAIELARAWAQADRLAPADAVTGLLSRDRFFELADREFRRSWRFEQPIAALQIDIDDFSKLHLMIGPTGADDLLRQVARATRPRVRNIDLMGRLDTDTLGVVLLMATREFGLGVAERLRRAVAELEVPTREGAWQVTASIGLASYPREQCASIHELFAVAEQATRAAKRAGRNRVVAV